MQIRPARRGDLSAVVAVMNAVDIATLGEPDSTETDIAAGWDESDFDLSRDALVAEVDGEVVGYAEVYDRGDHGAPRVIDVDVFVNPIDATELATALLDAALARADEAAAGAGGAVQSTWLPAGDPRVAGYTARGFSARRQFLRMRYDITADAPSPPDVPGIRLAAARRGQDEAAVHDVLVEAFANHVRPITPSFARFVELHVEHPDFDPTLWVVAWDGDTAVGALTLFDHGDLAFIRHIGVRGSHRGRGIASALILRGLQLLSQRGQTRVDLGVDFEDEVGAARLYASLGFTELQRQTLFERVAEGS